MKILAFKLNCFVLLGATLRIDFTQRLLQHYFLNENLCYSICIATKIYLKLWYLEKLR